MIYHYVIMADAMPALLRWEGGEVDVLLFSSHERAFFIRARFRNAVGVGTLDSQVIPVEVRRAFAGRISHYLLDLDPEDFEGETLALKDDAVLVRWPLTVESLEGVVT